MYVVSEALTVTEYTGWLKIKYPSRHYAISKQPAADFKNS